jgi:LPPG:FO 2-phospho-L-lactate transferase
VPVGADEATAAPGVLDAVAAADVILLAPSNPVVSVGTILSVPGVRTAMVKADAKIVGISPIVNDKPVRGMADACLTAIGVETTAQAVGRHYGSRTSAEGLLDGWLVHTGDPATVPDVEVRAVPLLMSDVVATAAMVRAAFDVAGVSVE